MLTMSLYNYYLKYINVIDLNINVTGPYGCADVHTSLTCMSLPSLVNVDSLISKAQTEADKGNIDPLSGLQNDRVFILDGAEDAIVDPGKSDINIFKLE